MKLSNKKTDDYWTLRLRKVLRIHSGKHIEILNVVNGVEGLLEDSSLCISKLY